MKFFASVAAVAALAGSTLAQQINTPASLTECVPVLLSWSGGQSPYFLNVLPGGEASGTPLKQFGQISGTSTTWVVDLTSGTEITLALTDSSGATVYSSPVTILTGTSSDCVTGGSAAQTLGGSSTAAAAAGTGSSAAAAGTTTTAAAASSSPAAASSPALSSTTEAASSSAKATAASSSAAAAAAESSASSSGEKVVLSAGALALAALVPLFA